MLDNSIATCVVTILLQLRVASNANDSKMNEVHDSKVKAQERFQEVQEQVQEVHDSTIKVQEQVQEVHGSQIKVQEQVQEVHGSKMEVQEQVQGFQGQVLEVYDSKIKVQERVRYHTAKTVATTRGFPRLESIRLHRLRDKQAVAMLPHLGRWCYRSALYSSTAWQCYMVVL